MAADIEQTPSVLPQAGTGLCVHDAPLIRAPEKIRTIYAVTLCAACGPLAVGVVLFGWRAAVLAGISISSCVLFEHVYYRLTRVPSMLGRTHACLTGVLLALTLPPYVPFYVPIVGAAFAVILGKAIFGGVGHFLWQPALLGRIAVAVIFMGILSPMGDPGAMPGAVPAPGYGYILSEEHLVLGDVTLASRIERYQSWRDEHNSAQLRGRDAFEVPLPRAVLSGLTDRRQPHYSYLAYPPQDRPAALGGALLHLPPPGDLVMGARPGGIGETCAAAILVCGLYLVYRNYVKWPLPASMIVAAAVATAIAPVHLGDSATAGGLWRWWPITLPGEGLDVGFTYVNCQLLSTELALAAFFFATEMTSRPVTTGGQVIFGIGCGVLGVILRQYVGIPVPYYAAVLIMNTLTPKIDRFWRPRAIPHS